MMMRYETMYSHLSEMFDFLEIAQTHRRLFPKYRKRKTDWTQLPQNKQEILIQIYGSTRDYLATKPDVFFPTIIRKDK